MIMVLRYFTKKYRWGQGQINIEICVCEIYNENSRKPMEPEKGLPQSILEAYFCGKKATG